MLLINNIGELRELIKDLSDDTPMVVYRSNMEKSGNEMGVFMHVEKMKGTEYETVDAFDGTPYSYTIYERDRNGIECLRIS